MREQFSMFKINKWICLLILSVLIYSMGWTYIVLIRYYSLNATVYDLGTSAEGLYFGLHPSMQTSYGYIQSFLRSELTVILSPLSLFPNVTLLLIILQTILLSIPVFALYKIGKFFRLGELSSVIISLLYLFYPPLAGVNWYDFHFQALFIPLFLFGYLAYLSGKLKSSLVLLSLSGMVRFPYMGFIVLFAIIEIAIHHNIHNEKLNISFKLKEYHKFLLMLLSVSLTMLILTFFIDGGLSAFLSSSHLSSSSSSISISEKDRFETIIFMFIPLLFIPLLSKRWILFYIPFIYLAIFSSNFVYDYPYVFRMQYSAMFIPFIFLGLIDVLHTIRSEVTIKRHSKHFSANFIKKSVNFILIFLVVSVGVSASFMEPYGPYNNQTQGSFGFSQMVSQFNYTQYQSFIAVSKFIPKDAKYVLMQNNMPQLLPRPVPVTVMDSGTLTTFGNITNKSIMLNKFPYYVNGKWTTVKINYLFLDPWSGLSYSTQPMINFFDKLYLSGLYGVVAEDNGFVLLVRGYSGPLKLYKPLTYNVPLSSLGLGENSSFSDGRLFFHNSSGNIWWGPYMNLIPGSYKIKVIMSSTDTNFNDSLTLQMVISNGNVILGRKLIESSVFRYDNKNVSIIFNANLTIATNNIEFTGAISPHWQGELILSKILLKEISPNPTTF